jgi:polyhydroxyalkanoate synthase subunit PhaC
MSDARAIRADREGRRMRNLLGMFGRRAPQVGTTPADVIHRENKWRLLRYRPSSEGVAYATPVLLVPSLINRHYVLDLQRGRSFAEFLVARGHDVYIIDWGTPGDEDRYLEFDEICDRYLGRAVRAVARRSERGKVHLLGYCLGGTLTTIYTAARPERVASNTALAAPVDFHDDGLLSRWTRTETFDVGALVDGFGNVPWQLMQASFQMLRPTLLLAKLVGLVDRAWDDEFLDGFLAIERWGNDNVPFPGACYRRYIDALYRDNALVAGRFSLSGRPARLDAITCPTLVITFEHDHIVPWPSAAALVDHVSSQDAERLHLPGGHVGAVISRKAASTLWPAVSAWWAARDRDGEASGVSAMPRAG